VVGPSMETTLFTGDKLIVNRLTPSVERLFGGTYTPVRGQIIVFKNPMFAETGGTEEYIVKRVIGLPGERVTVKDGVVTVYNKQYPNGFYPDKTFARSDSTGPQSPTSGDVDETVQAGSIFAMGDHREGTYSLDSRNGLGQIPLYDIIGPVVFRFFPFNRVTTTF
jgi:signal peptidase I